MDVPAVAMGVALDDIAHVVQVALTPVFLLSGIASLLNVINTRYGRVADQSEVLQDRLRAAPEEDPMLRRRLGRRLGRLRRRLRVLDIARAAGALGGMCICAATFVLFLGALQNTAVATVLFACFGASILLTFAALAGMLGEALLSSQHGLAHDFD